MHLTSRSLIRCICKIKMGCARLLTIVTIVIVLMIPISVQNENIECPHKCDCLEEYVYVDCSKKNLVSVPRIPKWVGKLNLNYNKLTNDVTNVFEGLLSLQSLKLDDDAFTSIPIFLHQNQIEEISINRNNISAINIGHFPANSTLKSLSINGNHIKVIEEGALNNLTNLVILKLNRNEIVSLPNQLFKHQSNLKILELNHNKIHVITDMLFRGLSSLTTLKIKYNNIENIMDGAFFGFKSVNLLQLDHNRIQNISKDWMYGLESLTTLSLSNNLITQIDFGSWEFCPSLKELDLSHNYLIEIENRTFQHLTNLLTLNLSYNNISAILQEAFSHMVQLQILFLNRNKISWTVENMTGPFSKLQNLVKFNLSDNHIKSISSRDFEGLSNVVELDLRSNNITSIQQHSFNSTSKIKKLYLNSSSLICDCKLLWLVKWIRDKVEQNYITATCAYPAEVRGVVISRLNEDNCGDSPEPQITEHPNTHLAIKNRSTNLVCSATSKPFSNMTFLWKKNSGNISNPQVYENVTLREHGKPYATSVLGIPDVTNSDSGKYQCVVSNKFGTTYSSEAVVDIVTFPQFTHTPINVTVKTGNTAILNCAATGDPPPEISWKKDGENDFPAARERRMMPTSHHIFIVNAKTTDMGIYSCAAKNSAGTIIANATLSVLQEPPFIMMENKEVTSGDSVVLQCMISGSPKPALKWFKNGSPIVPTERHFFTAHDQVFVIIGAESSDAGHYECKITNELVTKKDIELKVLPPVAITVNEEDMLGLFEMHGSATAKQRMGDKQM
ncbi:leucine-rich repeats and immunoglobulin-like domains protein 3 [Bicyclus anynana]|uniref:Leucine-rich repeats and immunoglobulin-like domains protein 3 n=1 Tax=Bicyclus anynana TaxID=110368 RepID=A0ABM3LS13_BICAN|nr:leucine-rich repeats and immunoglobulin-like domains protein 3 [Bicyclus anynana]